MGDGVDGVGVLFVTGGSRGIGAAIARGAAAAGYDVALSYATQFEAAERVAAECRQRGVRALCLSGDVASEPDVCGWFERIDAELGPLRVLVNNAGITAPLARLETFSADRVRRVLEVNVLGALLCAREAVRRLSTARGGAGGSIVNVSSRAASLGGPGEYIDYAASKGAIDTLTVGLAKEVAPEGIRVNAVRPGLIHTDIHAASGDPSRVERMAAGVPLGRGGSSEEVAECVLWLASEAARYVTGALLDCSGGR